jgi:hypothetical protein
MNGILRNNKDEVDQERDDEDNRPTGAPSQVTHPKPTPSDLTADPMVTPKPPSHKMGKARSNTSIIAMLNPSRHIFRDWTPLPFTVHEDVGLEVGKEIIRKIAEALGHPIARGPICKRLARNDDGQTLADTWARRSEKGVM